MLNLTDDMWPPNDFPVLFWVMRFLIETLLKSVQKISSAVIRNRAQKSVLVDDLDTFLKHLLLAFKLLWFGRDVVSFKGSSRLVKIRVTFILDDRKRFKLTHWWDWLGKQHLVGFVVKQKFLLMVFVKWFYLIQQRGEHGVGWMVLNQVSFQVLWDWGNYFLINGLNIFQKLDWLVSLFLALFGQFQAFGKLFWIFIFKLNWKSADKLEQSITEYSNVELTRFFIVINKLNVGPYVLASLVNRGFTVGTGSIHVLFKPLLRF